MVDWPNYLNEVERARLVEIDQQRAALASERNQLMNRAKLRKHRKAPTKRDEWLQAFEDRHFKMGCDIIAAGGSPFGKP